MASKRKWGSDRRPGAVLSLLACGLLAAADGLAQDETERPLELPEPPVWPEIEPDADGADAGTTSTEADAPPVTRLETQLEIERLAEEERYDEALSLADGLIELTEREFGEQSLEAAEAYRTVAALQREAGRHEESESNFLHAVALIRDIDGTFSERAIEPLVGLGDNYHDAGQYLNAVTAYNEARTINRRVYGLLNERQIPIVDRVTQSLQELEQYEEADQQQLEILHLQERNHPVGSPEYLEALYRYASWLRRTGRYHEERSYYARAQRIIRDQHGKDSLLMVRPLREIGNSFRSQRIPDNQGISALNSALELLEQSSGEEPLMTAEVLRDIGDWEVSFSKVEPDLDLYRRAWRLLGDVENGAELRRQWFDELVNVLGEPISQRGLSEDPDAQRGYVIVQFDVDRYGRTQDVEVARSEPEGYKDDAVARAVRQWRFRPFMRDGEVIDKEDLALQFNYRYLPDEGT
ncbi:MAG: TonB family protein [Gammaproteobacteria bacterium]|nr:TonB family protein [Gammaproteobacteria bacterium]